MRFPLKSIALLTLSLLAAAPARAQQDAGLSGRWIRDAEASTPMKQILDDGMSKLGRMYRMPVVRGKARERLQSTNTPAPWLIIAPRGEQVTVQTPNYNLTTPVSGGPTKWERQKGDVIDVTTTLQGRRLEQTFDAPDGRRVNVYTLSSDGNTLNLDVTVTSPKLDSPLTYRMVYRRR